MKIHLSFVTGLLILCLSSPALSFNFAEDGQEEAQQKAAQKEKVRHLLSIPCQETLKKKKIALIIGEQHSGGEILVNQSNYGLLFEVINSSLREIGLCTYTQEEITKQIAREEIRAAMNNDPDAALSAARRLGAQFILRGLISSRAQVNPVLNINEVFVNMSFTLTHASGRAVCGVTAGADSYAGADVLSVALTLVEERADEVVAKLYHEFCEHASSSTR
jgi:hypothetical protein